MFFFSGCYASQFERADMGSGRWQPHHESTRANFRAHLSKVSFPSIQLTIDDFQVLLIFYHRISSDRGHFSVELRHTEKGRAEMAINEEEESNMPATAPNETSRNITPRNTYPDNLQNRKQSHETLEKDDLPPIILSLRDRTKSFRSLDSAVMEAMREELLRKVGPIKDSRLARGGDILIFPRDDVQARALLALAALNEQPVTTSRPNSTSTNVGIIAKVEPHYSEEQPTRILGKFNVTNVTRLKTKREGILEDTEKIKLYFTSSIPTRVMIGFVSFPVWKYIHAPFTCSRCFRIGHTRNRSLNQRPFRRKNNY